MYFLEPFIGGSPWLLETSVQNWYIYSGPPFGGSWCGAKAGRERWSAHLTCLFQDERLLFSYLLQWCRFELVFNYTGGCFEDLWCWIRNLRVSWLTWLHIFWKWGDMENHQQGKCLSSIPIWQLHYITCQKINLSQSQNGGCIKFGFSIHSGWRFARMPGYLTIWEDVFYRKHDRKRG